MVHVSLIINARNSHQQPTQALNLLLSGTIPHLISEVITEPNLWQSVLSHLREVKVEEEDLVAVLEEEVLFFLLLLLLW
jgi:hypothetical protein